MREAARGALLAAALVTGCASQRQPGLPSPYSQSERAGPQQSAVSPQEPPTEPLAGSGDAKAATQTAPAPTPPSPAESSPWPLPATCAGLACGHFPTPEAALQALDQGLNPQIWAFGEAHAKAGQKGPSTVTRFQQGLLPWLAPRSHFLLVELLGSPGQCEKETKKAGEATKPVTQGQSQDNQSEYIRLGKAARSLGVIPDILRPSCADLAEATQGEDAVTGLLELIGRLSASTLAREAGAKPVAAGRSAVIAYGGALHNDVEPDAGLEAASYAHRLLTSREASPTLVEIDLLLPEGIGESPWARRPWFPAVRAGLSLRAPGQVLLLQRSPNSFALVLPDRAPTESGP